MKIISILSLALILNLSYGYAQNQMIADSLRYIYLGQKLSDTAKLKLLKKLSFNEVRDNKLGLQYAEELISLSGKLDSTGWLRAGYALQGNKLRLLGRLEEALGSYIKSAELAKTEKNLKAQGETYGYIADTYSVAGNHDNAGKYYKQAIKTLRLSGDSINLAAALSNAGDELLKTKQYDTAKLYFIEAKNIFTKAGYESGIGYSLGNLGVLYANTGNTLEAEKNINKAIVILEANEDFYPICDYLLTISDVYKEKGELMVAIQYAKKSVALAGKYNLNEQVANASKKLSVLYEDSGNATQSLRYYKMYYKFRDSLNNLGTVQKMADLRTGFEVSKKQGEVNLLTRQKLTQRNLLIASVLIAVLALFIVLMLIRSNKHKKHAFQVLKSQTKQTEIEKAKAENALEELSKTQAQLIESAKLASLGELTAGIAHEIQNPLNFINNFSEVSHELLDEMNDALTKGNAEEVKIISQDLKQNLAKITQHGKRADAIVKGMLQHSQSSTGKKEPTDINALCDEYFRLSYHGLRAKDKSFNAAMKTDFDPSIKRINVVPQEMGRVILNLLTNAFYACAERNRNINFENINLPGTGPAYATCSLSEKSGPVIEARTVYQPTVSIATKSLYKKVKILVSDNGNGIPENLRNKIFQPFFTTKPTGQGTGLGLSLCYDIVKAHGGEIKVESEENQGTTFIIELPTG